MGFLANNLNNTFIAKQKGLSKNMKNIFCTTDILIPQTDNMTAWSVVACDQYTSEPQYWKQTVDNTCGFPSTYPLVFPEAYLKTADFNETVNSINSTMIKYLSDGLFKEYTNSYIYLERKLKNGKIRKGLIGAVDLEHYDYQKGSKSCIRATEGTVLERIPPRVLIRKDAPLELPHVMLLIDDENKTVIEPLADSKGDCTPVYDFKLMHDSGSIKGYLLNNKQAEQVNDNISKLSRLDDFNKRYNTNEKDVLLFAVGDGNHSLATAKKCYMNLKEELGEEALNHPARYALVELVNLHDYSLEFEAIHRIMFDVNPNNVIAALKEYFIVGDVPDTLSQQIDIVVGRNKSTVYINNPTLNLAVGSLQEFIDSYLHKHNGEVDYIHGEDVVSNICAEDENSIGFILPSMDKNDLFKTVILDGALPRKTFSMGEACDKRFYLEARKIQK